MGVWSEGGVRCRRPCPFGHARLAVHASTACEPAQPAPHTLEMAMVKAVHLSKGAQPWDVHADMNESIVG